jgi:cation transport regulator
MGDDLPWLEGEAWHGGVARDNALGQGLLEVLDRISLIFARHPAPAARWTLTRIKEIWHPGDQSRRVEEATMPYARDEDLPASVRNHLPPHAQEIFRGAFNHAWQTYSGSARVEEIAHRVAWAAVKKRYRKCGRDWVLRTDVGDEDY